MGNPRRFDLDHRLEAYFATLLSSPLKDVVKRAANWQLYAAVTGSAMAMATSASTSIIGSGVRDVRVDPIASVLAARGRFTASKDVPLMNAVRLAMARQDSAQRLLGRARLPSNRATATQAPSISPGGVVPLDGTQSIIQSGEWVTIYGANLASATTVWNGDFPTSLGGTKVEINGKPAYIMFVSPGQINVQAPDDRALGTVSVVVTTAAGSATAYVTLADFAPSFSLVSIPKKKASLVSGIILRRDGSGAYGKGAYDILGPSGNFLGYPTVAAYQGDIVELFGVGFGPTDPAVPAGKAYSGAAPITSAITLYIHDIAVKPSFVGLSNAGLYQINFTVPPGLGEGEVPIQAVVGGMLTQPRVFFSLKKLSSNPGGGTGGFTGTPGGGFGTGFGTGGFTGGGGGTLGGTGGMTGGGGTGGTGGGGGNGGTGGGGNGGTGAGGGTGGGSGGGGGTGGGSGGGGGGSYVTPRSRPYTPKLRYPHESDRA